MAQISNTPVPASAFRLEGSLKTAALGAPTVAGGTGEGELTTTLHDTVDITAWLGTRHPEIAGLVAAAGADVIVAGSAVFNGRTPEAYRSNISAIRAAADAASMA